ncbi:MAG: DUF4974 domain-containing protein, partial [Bacteroidales bacterium]|nr:DUF4974 domain-containing protein [Bacteroidales bacterium]
MDLNDKEIEGTLLLKYISETANGEERAQVETWLSEDPANNDTLLQMARIYHAQRSRQRIRQRNPHRALRRVQQRIAQHSRRIVIRRLAVAASLLIGILGVASLAWQTQQNELPPQMITVTTNTGMRSQLTLPDGTEVQLNVGSMLVYPSQYDKNERRVQLSGEAYFNVAHHADQPFVVSVADDKVNVQVLGTQFNLQAYEKDGIVQTTLIEGSVQVGIQGKKETIILTPSDRVIYNTLNNNLLREKIDPTQVTAWKDGQLIFRNAPMSDVLRQLTHFYDVDFEVKDEVIYGDTFTGKFQNVPLFQILEYLKISSKINYTMEYSEDQD